MWGWNESGQLGFDQDKHPTIVTPTPLPLPDDLNVTEIAAGSRHSLFKSGQFFFRSVSGNY